MSTFVKQKEIYGKQKKMYDTFLTSFGRFDRQNSKVSESVAKLGKSDLNESYFEAHD